LIPIAAGGGSTGAGRCIEGTLIDKNEEDRAGRRTDGRRTGSQVKEDYGSDWEQRPRCRGSAHGLTSSEAAGSTGRLPESQTHILPQPQHIFIQSRSPSQQQQQQQQQQQRQQPGVDRPTRRGSRSQDPPGFTAELVMVLLDSRHVTQSQCRVLNEPGSDAPSPQGATD
ncbi:hypothetical protein INR49_020811, partial [Caranx melampygus]